MQAVKQASQLPAKGTNELDELLPESTMATLSKDFRNRYNTGRCRAGTQRHFEVACIQGIQEADHDGD